VPDTQTPTPQNLAEYGTPLPEGAKPYNPGLAEYSTPLPEGAKPYTGPKEPGLFEKAVTYAGKPMETLENVEHGALKSAAEGTVGLASELIHRIPGVGETLVPSEGLEKERELFTRHGIAEKAGGLVEQAGEFAAGEGELKAIGLVSRMEPWMLRLAHNNKFVSRLLMEAVKGGLTGAVQGAAHEGGATGEITKGAEEGGIGGALGGAAGEAIASGAKPLARALGLGGLTTNEAMTQGARPYVNDYKNWNESLKIGMPRIIRDAQAKGFKTLEDFVNIAKDADRDLWRNTVQPQITRNAKEMFTGASVENRVMSVLKQKQGTAWAMAPKLFKAQTDAVKEIADQFHDFQYNLSQADNLREALGDELTDLYRMSASDAHQAKMLSGRIAGLEAAYDGLRDQIYGRLATKGEATPAAFRKEYGAIKDIVRSLEKRVPVDARQSPLNVTQTLGLMAGLSEMGTAFLTGHPLTAAAGVIPIAVAAASKIRNRPVSLVRQALETANPGVIRRTLQGPVKRAAGAAAGFAGEQAALAALPTDHVAFRASDGSMHSVPLDSMDEARKIDPGLQVIPREQ